MVSCSSPQSDVSCGSYTSVEAGYRPPFVPITLTIKQNGAISFSTSQSIVTPVGTFSLQENILTNLSLHDNETLLVIRHQVGKEIVDQVFRINSGEELVAVINGRTIVSATSCTLLIDASKGDVESIELNSASQPPSVSSEAVREKPTTDDAFSDPLTIMGRSNHWAWGAGADAYRDNPQPYYDACFFDVDGYHFSGLVGNCSSNLDLRDTNIIVTATLVKQTSECSWGVGFGNGYHFRYSSEGEWRLSSGYGAAYVLQGTDHTAFRKGIGVSNELRVTVNANQVVLYMNNVAVGEYRTESPPYGVLQLNSYGACEVIFRDLVVSPP